MADADSIREQKCQSQHRRKCQPPGQSLEGPPERALLFNPALSHVNAGHDHARKTRAGIWNRFKGGDEPRCNTSIIERSAAIVACVQMSSQPLGFRARQLAIHIIFEKKLEFLTMFVRVVRDHEFSEPPYLPS